MEIDQALIVFAAGGESAARAAFDTLAADSRAFVEKYVRRNFFHTLSAEQREDTVQDTFTRIWLAREGYRAEGAAAWYGFLKVTARHCAIDFLRKRSEAAQDSAVIEDTTAEDHAGMLQALLDALDLDTLRHQADVLWLGLSPALPPEAHERRLLAAQYLLLDGLPWKTVGGLLSRPRPGEPPLTREALDGWLADPGVLRHLAYRTLYYSNDRLAGHLLCLTDPSELDAVAAVAASGGDAAPPPEGWTWPETAVILWRYRNAMPVDKIRQRADLALSGEDLAGLLVRTIRCFPFHQEMVSLLTALDRPGRQALTDRGLWQRLAFQYCYGDELAHQDIQDRTQPAFRHVAEPSQPEITLGMLNVWLSNRRLLKSLARACGAQTDQGGSDGDD